MPSTQDQITNLEAELDGLVSPTTAQVDAVTRDYDADVVAAVAAKRSLGAGGGVLTTRAQYSGTQMSINNFGQGYLTVDSLDAGDALLDISTPDTPVVIAAGDYLVAVTVKVQESMTEAGSFRVVFSVGSDSDTFVLEADSSVAAPSATANPTLCLSGGWYFTAGAQMGVRVYNNDGANARLFSVRMLQLLRLS